MITIDISEHEALPKLDIAPDMPGEALLLRLSDECELIINFRQLDSLYEQVAPWFVEEKP